MSEARECEGVDCKRISVSIVPYMMVMGVISCHAIYLQFVFCEVCCCPKEAGHFKNRRIAHYCILALCLLATIAVIVVECLYLGDFEPGEGSVFEEKSYGLGLYLEIGSLLLIVPGIVWNIIMQVILHRLSLVDEETLLLLSQTGAKGAVILSTVEPGQNSQPTHQTFVVVV